MSIGGCHNTLKVPADDPERLNVNKSPIPIDRNNKVKRNSKIMHPIFKIPNKISNEELKQVTTVEPKISGLNAVMDFSMEKKNILDMSTLANQPMNKTAGLYIDNKKVDKKSILRNLRKQKGNSKFMSDS